MTGTGAHCVELDTVPDLLALHRADPARFPFLLESAATGGSAGHTLGRYDILFCEPGAALTLTADALHSSEAADFFEQLNALTRAAHSTPELTCDLPFRGGWFVYLAYELAAQVEPVLTLQFDTALPVAMAVRVRTAIIICRQQQRAYVVSEEGAAARWGAELARHTAVAPAPTSDVLVRGLTEDAPQRYLDAVTTAKRHIVDGDVFQANLSRQWRADVVAGVDDALLYANLRHTNAAPFAGLMRWGDASIVSSSPERLVRLQDRVIETRPIAGTRPRGVDDAGDAALSAELLAHPKERAEHVMLIDLERNDLGRVCKPGTVQVDELMAIETYAHVHHIVSNIRGHLRDDVGVGDALRAVFPGGTITGCPKVRCMQIIAALEGAPRGAYTGSMGYINRDGSGDFNILIRTLVRDGARLSLRAGAGIVADSQPTHELAETRAKARGMLLALNATSIRTAS